MKIPNDVRLAIQEKLWKAADEAGFLGLPDLSKSTCYDNWVSEAEIGGRLIKYMEPHEVRHYLKDAYMKRYARERRNVLAFALEVLAIPADTPVRRRFIKPLGVELRDGRIICWGEAKIWKNVLMALHERGFGVPKAKRAAALLFPHARFQSTESRLVVEDAAKKLGIRKVVWLSDS